MIENGQMFMLPEVQQRDVHPIPSLSIWQETIQKALRMVDEASLGFDPIRYDLELNRRGSVAWSQGQPAGGSVESFRFAFFFVIFLQAGKR